MVKLIVALSFVLVLADAYIAEASCAWVLWENLLPGDTWNALGGWEDLNGCRIGRGAKYASLKLSRPIAGQLITLGAGKDGRDVFVRYDCLPDTIDPRGPKAK